MKKRILRMMLAVVMIVCLVGCNHIEDKSKSENKSMFVAIENTSSWLIVYHRYTKVMYAVAEHSNTFTLLVDENGNHMIWEG